MESNNVPKENIFRTTFHPDSDYSTFVGAYKPTMEKAEEQLYRKEELISKLTELRDHDSTYSSQKFGGRYWYSLKQLSTADKKDILVACGMSDSYIVEINKGIAVGEDVLGKSKESRIVYSYIPQAFLNAYMQAYRKPDENIYLVIEEINRGNCAQIFGDLFQLLDRDENGVSEYSIKADADLKSFLEEKLGKESDAIKDGELCLPPNLYIYATMNTSDQSLFPIDSAFKRRWDWEYEPIKYKNDDWIIEIQGTKYSWVSFQKEINKRILEATSSEDKMLGDYFVNPVDGRITDKMLLNKVLFYLWNDVCKDGEGDIFKTSDTEDVSFSELYDEEGKSRLLEMMEYLHVEKLSKEVQSEDETQA
ncbi:MAG: AAA family ATPase [Porphyromonadaceae bacterium]|nr:AAA family ATPase [Porphyromonadaceae bacterium]